ncbi:kinase-like domain-containing protein, partial [Tribonema minus]
MGNSLPSSLDLGGRVVKIKCQIAEGGCGYVYKGEDELGKEYALKIVRVARERGGGPVVDEEAAEMASLEQTVVKRLCPHPNIVEAFDCGTTWEDSEVRYHILSEFCPRSVLGMLSDARRGPAGHLPERDIMWILRDTLMALLHMHSQSPPIAHRDLKVENLLIGADGRCKLCDFGSCSVTHRAFAGARDAALAKEEIRRRTTPAYRAPEQVDLHLGHVVSERVDVWALGVLLFKLAFGATPFEDARGDVQNLGILGGFRAER